MSEIYQKWLDSIPDKEKDSWELDDWSHNSWNQALKEALEIVDLMEHKRQEDKIAAIKQLFE